MSRMKAFVLSSDDHEAWSGPDRNDPKTIVGAQRHNILVIENAVRTCNAYMKAGRDFASSMLSVINVDAEDVARVMDALDKISAFDEDERSMVCLVAFEQILERKFFPDMR